MIFKPDFEGTFLGGQFSKVEVLFWPVFTTHKERKLHFSVHYSWFMGVICDHWFRVIQDPFSRVFGVLFYLLCHAKAYKAEFLWHLTSLENWINLNFQLPLWCCKIERIPGLWIKAIVSFTFWAAKSRVGIFDEKL